MKLLIVHWGSRGGGPKYAFDMARGLAAIDDIDLHVSFSSYADNAHEWTKLTENLHPIRTYRSLYELVTGLPRWIASMYSLRRYIAKNNISVVYSPMLSIWQSSLLFVWLKKDLTYVSTIHDARPHPGDLSTLVGFCQSNELRRAQGVIVLSEHVQHELTLVSPKSNVFVIPIGVDAAITDEKDLPSGQVIIGFFGRILEYKGIELFVDTVLELQNRGYNVAGQVFGSGEVDNELVNRGGRLVEWNNRWIDNNEIDTIFAAFHVVLLPYIEASQSGVISIACRYGLPQVVTPVGGLEEQVRKTGSGLIAEEVSVHALADRIAELLTTPDLYRNISKKACDAGTGEFGWDRSAEVLMEVAKKLNG